MKSVQGFKNDTPDGQCFLYFSHGTLLNMRKTLYVLLIFFTLIEAYAQQQYYELKNFVTDSAYVFDNSQVENLNERLVAFEAKTSNQIVIVTIEQLGFDTIETYANGIFNQNGIGKKDADNGLLILFSLMDRKVRIEVGYGLEPYITDAVASRIIRNTMIPNFKKENYYEGINEGANQLIEFLNEPSALEEFKKEIAYEDDKEQLYMNIFIGIFLSIFIIVGGFFFFKSYKNIIEVFRGVFIGKLGVVPSIFMLLGGSLSTLFGTVFMIVPMIVAYSIYTSDKDFAMQMIDEPKVLLWLLIPFFGIAAIIAVVKLKISGKDDLDISWIKNDTAYYRKTFSSSGTHSFSSGRSSSGGRSSSFSGGGGSSGGGGASGSW